MSIVRRNCAASCAAIVWLSAGLALAQSGPSTSPVKPAQAVDYSLDYGTAAVSDDGESNSKSTEADPSWVARKSKPTTGQLSEPDMGQALSISRIPARNAASAQASDQAPPPPDAWNKPADSSGGCTSCEGGCNCNSCDSCGCDDCKHKCHPIIQIDDCCPLKCEDQTTKHLFDDCCWLKCRDMTITGWADAGIMGNGRDTADKFNGPLTFPDRNGEGQLNQGWLAIDRTAPADNCGLFIGGHVDYMFGSDYFFTTAAGLDGTPVGNVPRWNTTDSFLYGFAMPQLYVETDFDNDWKIKWGHFFTIIGYEVVPATGNFFYSHAYTMQYGEPFTHTGFLASKTKDNWTAYGGVVAGWNTFNTDDRAAYLGGLTYADKDWGSLAFSIITGDDSEFNLPGVGPFASRTMYSLVWSRNFTSRFSYVLQHDYGTQNQAQTASGNGGAQWYGINQYLFYKLNCCWTAGLRVEWFRDDDGFVVTGLRPGNSIVGASFPGNFYEITAGLNYKPNANLAIRPEVRWDWYDGKQNQNQFVPVTSPYDAGTRNNQFTYGIDLVYQF
jgi:hypothetical protein